MKQAVQAEMEIRVGNTDSNNSMICGNFVSLLGDNDNTVLKLVIHL
jgi:hypothetical protein